MPEPRRFREGASVTESNRRWWTLGALAFSLFMICLDNTVVNVALPAIQRDLHVGLSQLEWTINAYTLTFAVLLLLGGKLADYLGRRRIFLVGMAIFTVASLGCGLATTGGMLIAARSVQGAGAALMMPATLSLIMVTFPREERGRAIGIWAAVSVSALALGPLVGGLLIQHGSWQWIFFVNVPIGTLGIVLGRLVIPESRDSSADQRLDLAGIATSALGLFLLTFALIEADRFGWGSTTIVACFVGAAVMLLLFVVIEYRQRAPMLELTLFNNPTFAGANVVELLIMVVMFGVFFFTSVYLQIVNGWSPVQTGAMFLPLTCIMILEAPIAGWLSDRIGSRWLMSAGMLILGIAVLLLGRTGQQAHVWQLLPAFVVGGIGIGMTLSPAMAAVLGSAPEDKSGVAAGVLDTFRQVGGALGVSVMGAVVANSLAGAVPGSPTFAAAFVSGYRSALHVAAFAAFAGSLTAALLVRQYRRLDAPEVAEASA
jgi:EmrB/QacA subfamily drug resistance transporter